MGRLVKAPYFLTPAAQQMDKDDLDIVICFIKSLFSSLSRYPLICLLSSSKG